MAPDRRKRAVKVCGVDVLVPALAACALTWRWPWLGGAWMLAFWAVFFRDRWPARA